MLYNNNKIILLINETKYTHDVNILKRKVKSGEIFFLMNYYSGYKMYRYYLI